ncbi:MAG: aminotransferase class V-fold PLP-dependent enzyme [Candidatus Nanopelagicales bacterium]
MQRAFLAADGGQPLTATARRALDHALAVGWADPTLRAHEGRSSRLLLDTAAQTVAASVRAPTAAVSFYPGASAALRAAIAAALRRHPGSQSSHPGPVLAAGAADRQVVLGFDAGPRIEVDGVGRIRLDSLAAALGDDGVGAVCLQVGNPEVGTRQPLSDAAAICRSAGVPLVVDATMAAGRAELPADWGALVLDARSWAGGTDVAAVVVAPGSGIAPGSGPLPLEAPGVPNCAAAALSLEAAQADLRARSLADHAATGELRHRLAALPDVAVHGDPEDRLPHVVGCSALYIDAEALLLELDRRGISVASGSACATAAAQPSHVLAAMGVLTSGNIRVTLPVDRRPDDLQRLVTALPEALASLRAEAGLQ